MEPKAGGKGALWVAGGARPLEKSRWESEHVLVSVTKELNLTRGAGKAPPPEFTYPLQ